MVKKEVFGKKGEDKPTKICTSFTTCWIWIFPNEFNVYHLNKPIKDAFYFIRFYEIEWKIKCPLMWLQSPINGTGEKWKQTLWHHASVWSDMSTHLSLYSFMCCSFITHVGVCISVFKTGCFCNLLREKWMSAERWFSLITV